MLVNEFAEDIAIYSFISSVDEVDETFAKWQMDNVNTLIVAIETVALPPNNVVITIIYKLGE